MKKGIVLDNKKIVPSRVKLKRINKSNNTCIVEITVHDGINHEVRRLFDSLGYEVLKLKRERVGMFTIDGLTSGNYRKLSPKEVKIVYSMKK